MEPRPEGSLTSCAGRSGARSGEDGHGGAERRVVLADGGLARPPSQQGGGQSSAGQIEISEERILDADADHMFVTSYPDPSGSSAATQQRFESNPLWGTLIGQIHTAPDTTWMSAVGIQGAQSILDDLAATFGVDPARS